MTEQRILILKFPYSSTFGGGEKHTLTLVERLSANHKFFLASTCTVLLSEFSKRDWHYRRIWAGTEPVTPLALLSFFFTWPFITANLVRWLVYYKFQHHISVIFCLSLTEKILLTPFARLLGIKVIWMEHLQIERWLKQNPLRLIYVLWSHLATIVTVVEAVKDQLQQLGVPTQHIQVIYNSVNVKDFTPSPSAVQNIQNIFRVLFIGRLAREKGINDLIQAIKIVQAQIPQVHLTIVGEGDIKDQLTSLVHQLDLNKQIDLVGFRNDIPAVLQNCDVLVLPSIRRETFGIVLIEALATVKPVIATTTGGMTEIIDRYGWLVPPHRPAAIAEALYDVYNNYELAVHKASNGRIRVLELFQEHRMIEDYDTLFKSR
ncbi:MAG: glycosyltransferase family 4 protein [Patescibacteria group bacterium]|jgi:glycosyltransferase involved in cell wall biosynthesis